eukprot:NODE_4658_length_456_cov_487.331695_g4018_i0.p1 GENE.NODE_4658_length_456_cov_487.331695_g4018_i0~~NODE_4658_length_456_cov_487.331695_g4018_i0.p1  ORF type:complete len:102 (+),score=11.95 NODE_4658_length_456_cov_487.331695_g4018_i0:74-379(+)
MPYLYKEKSKVKLDKRKCYKTSYGAIWGVQDAPDICRAWCHKHQIKTMNTLNWDGHYRILSDIKGECTCCQPDLRLGVKMPTKWGYKYCSEKNHKGSIKVY